MDTVLFLVDTARVRCVGGWWDRALRGNREGAFDMVLVMMGRATS